MPGEGLLLLTPLELVHLPPTLPRGFWLPGCSLSWSGSALQPEAAGELDLSGGRGASGHYVPSQEWEIGNVPGQGTGLWGKHAGNIHSPSRAAPNLAGPAGSRGGGRHITGAARPAWGPWYICAHLCRVYSPTHSQITPQPCTHTVTHVATCSFRFICTHVTHRC